MNDVPPKKSGLTRRFFVTAAAAAMGTPANLSTGWLFSRLGVTMPGRLVASAAAGPAEVIYSLYALLHDEITISNPAGTSTYNTLQMVRGGNINTVFTHEETFVNKPALSELDFSQRLGFAWQGNLSYAAERIRDRENIAALLDAGLDINPYRFFEFIEQKGNQAIVANIVAEQLDAPHPDIEDVIGRIPQFARTHSAFSQATSMRQIIDIMNGDVARALELPLQDGCFDRTAKLEDLGDLRYLLTKAPNLFPPERLPTFQRLADHLERHGRQTVTLEELEWHFRIENPPYRLGLSRLQESWQNTALHYRIV